MVHTARHTRSKRTGGRSGPAPRPSDPVRSIWSPRRYGNGESHPGAGRLVITSPAASLIRCADRDTVGLYRIGRRCFQAGEPVLGPDIPAGALIAAAHQAIRVLTDPAETGAVTLARLRTCRLRRTIIRIRCLRKRYTSSTAARRRRSD